MYFKLFKKFISKQKKFELNISSKFYEKLKDYIIIGKLYY